MQNSYFFFFFFSSPKYFPKHCSNGCSCNASEGYPRGEMKVRAWLQGGHGKSQWFLQTSALLSWFQWLIEQQPKLWLSSDEFKICTTSFQRGKCHPCKQQLIYNNANCWGLSLGIMFSSSTSMWTSFQPCHSLSSPGSRDRAPFWGQAATSLFQRCPIALFVLSWNPSSLFFSLIYLQWGLWFLVKKEKKTPTNN